MITALTAVVLLSTSTWIITSKAEEQVKSAVYESSKEKVSQEVAISEVAQQSILNAEVDEDTLIAEQKVALAIRKAKKDELVKIAEANRLAKISLDEKKQAEALVKKEEAIKKAQIAADKAKQEEIARIAAERADATRQAKIAEKYRIDKAASDKAEKLKADKLAKINADKIAKKETDRLAKIETDRLAKIEADRLAKVEIERLAKENAGSINKEEIDRLAKIEKDRLAKIEADRLAKLELDKIAKIEADRLAKIEADKLAAKLGLTQTENGAKLSGFLSNSANVTSVLNRAVELNGGDQTNTCVYFSSEAMRRIGVPVPLATCNTRQYLRFLKARSWVSSYDIKKLTPGSICFTTNDWAGYPTHTFVFMGWVTSGNYTSAYIADNQGSTVHVRSMGATYYTDAFAYFMHN
jgi:hypothetical protein